MEIILRYELWLSISWQNFQKILWLFFASDPRKILIFFDGIYFNYFYQGTITLSQNDLPRFAPGQKIPNVSISQINHQGNQRMLHVQHNRNHTVNRNMATFDFKDNDNDTRIKTSITTKLSKNKV
jgi:hypothetical protein